MAGAIRECTGLEAAHYHAGMPPKARMQVQNDWRQGKVQARRRQWVVAVGGG